MVSHGQTSVRHAVTMLSHGCMMVSLGKVRSDMPSRCSPTPTRCFLLLSRCPSLPTQCSPAPAQCFLTLTHSLHSILQSLSLYTLYSPSYISYSFILISHLCIITGLLFTNLIFFCAFSLSYTKSYCNSRFGHLLL